MSRSVKLCAVAVLAIMLALSSAQNVFASTELIYDDGLPANAAIFPNAGVSMAVRFSLPAGVSSAKLLTARYNLDLSPTTVNTFTVRILDDDRTTDLTPPFSATPSAVGWFDVDLIAKNIIVTRDFYIVLKNVNGMTHPSLFVDTSNPIYGRSWGDGNGFWEQNTIDNFMIRAVISSPAGAPVGGFMEPVNNLTIVAPYLALFGIVATVAVVVWKKREN